MHTRFAGLGVILACALLARADVKLPAILGPDMVLQQESRARFWGWADPGETVRVVAYFEPPVEASAAAGDDGRWSVELPTPSAGGPYSVAIEGKNRIVLPNVLVGEVWVASGQSNMEMPVGDKGGGYRGVKDWQRVAQHATNDEIRFFTVVNKVSPAPLDDCEGRWVACDTGTVLDFSGTAYFFASELAAELNVPVGVIATDWGGTPIEAWTSLDTLGARPEYADRVEDVRLLGTNPEALKAKYDQRRAQWRDKYASSEHLTWNTAELDDSTWMETTLPSGWTTPDLANFDGTVWYRHAIDVPGDWAGKDLTLELGPIDDEDTTYWNGVEIGAMRGSGHWSTPRRYTVPGALVSPGRAVIGVAAVDTGGLGGINGSPEQLSVGPSQDARQSLAGTWRYRKAPESPNFPPEPREPSFGPHAPASLYNAMIAPITPFTIRGAIWYQGESNRGNAFAYRTLMPGMIADWRRAWSIGDFPFYLVQIAPFTYGNDRGETAELREAQLLTLATPNTGLAVTMDAGNPADIHPNDKQTVGNRLARWALAKAYNRTDIAHSGPLFRAMRVEGATVVVEFDHAEGLASPDDAPKHFEVSGEDRVWHAAGAIVDGNTVRVTSHAVAAPVAVRYAWDDDVSASLFNGAGLPASPFRSDDWPRVTQPRP